MTTDILYRVHHFGRRILLTFLGPAQLDSAHDPLKELDRAWEDHFGSHLKKREVDLTEHEQREVSKSAG